MVAGTFKAREAFPSLIIGGMGAESRAGRHCILTSAGEGCVRKGIVGFNLLCTKSSRSWIQRVGSLFPSRQIPVPSLTWKFQGLVILCNILPGTTFAR